MKTKVANCGNYNCTHCSCAGQCSLTSISITPEGKCAQYKPVSSGGKVTIVPFTEEDEHTNMC